MIEPYLSFEGRCEEALNFYRDELGAQVTEIRRFKESPMPASMIPPGCEDKILHSSFILSGTTIMASDADCGGKPVFQGMSLSYSVPNEAEADRVFAALADGGEVRMPLSETFFSPRFGMVADRFGVSWLVIVRQS